MGVNMQDIIDKTSKISYILNNDAFQCKKTNFILQIEKLFFRGDIHHIVFGKHILMINPKTKIAISDSFPLFFDYMSVVNDLHGLEHNFKFKKIEENEFNSNYTALLQKDAEMMSVDILLWRIFSDMLDKSVNYQKDTLKLKLNYMPNVLELKDYLPAKAMEIFSSCLMTPKTLAELAKQFPEVSQLELNQLFILAILSNMGDLQIAYDSINRVNNININETPLFKNENVKRAKQTGFFQRFIHAIIK